VLPTWALCLDGAELDLGLGDGVGRGHGC
jgi:hypothetical protein